MKRKGASLASSFGLIAAARALQAGQTVVLTYHGVLSDEQPADDFLDHNFVSAAAFERQVAFLCDRYRPISLDELSRCYASGRRPPGRAVAITFDDGFANNYSVAFPILQRRGVPFTVFVTTGMVETSGAQLWTERVKRAIYLCPAPSVTVALGAGAVTLDLASPAKRAAAARAILLDLKRCAPSQRDVAVHAVERTCGRPELQASERARYDFLTWQEIRTMADAGVEFGSHTVNHPILSTLDEQTLDHELRVSKETLERQLGRECYAFAYPNGSAADYGAREGRLLERLGYRCAFSLRGTLNGARPDRFAIDRININRKHDDPLFEAAAAGLLGRARRARDGWMRPLRQPGAARTEART